MAAGGAGLWGAVEVVPASMTDRLAVLCGGSVHPCSPRDVLVISGNGCRQISLSTEPIRLQDCPSQAIPRGSGQMVMVVVHCHKIVFCHDEHVDLAHNKSANFGLQGRKCRVKLISQWKLNPPSR